MKALFAFAALITLTACAPSARSVAPTPMYGAFDDMGCEKVAAAMIPTKSEVEALSARQNGAAAQDAVSVFLIGLPTSAVSGNNVQGDLAAAKGKLNALEARAASCGVVR